MKAVYILMLATMLGPALFLSCSKESEKAESGDQFLLQQGNTPVMTGIACLDSMPFGRLNATELRSMVQARKLELLALDLCMALNNPNRPELLDDAASGEYRHCQWTCALYTRYTIADPYAGHQAGLYADTAFQNLYNRLLNAGTGSWIDALASGAAVEEYQVARYEEMENLPDQRDLSRVYSHLALQSRNLLRQFYAEINRLGGNYAPHFLSRVAFHRIVSTRQEQEAPCP